jgi:acetyl-CoA carboxylase biotin carboxyl carrier protein
MIDLEKLEKILDLMSRYGVDVVQAESAKERFAVARNAPQANFFSGSNSPMGTPFPVAAGGSADQSGAGGTGAMGYQQQQAQQGGASNNSGAPGSQPVGQSAATVVSNSSAGAASASGTLGGQVQLSELVGTFYRAASPTSTAFAEVGKKVRKGQTLCIVEAMKIMNEIESEWDGEIVEVLVENGKPVEFGTPLFRIKTS